MKMTFYGQFVGGEDQEATRGLIAHNLSFGVGSILDYGVEEDLSQEEAEEKEMNSCPSQVEREGQREGQESSFTAPQRTFGDLRVGIPHKGEGQCDRHLHTFLRCLEASAGSADGFSAIKLTALGRPQFLLQFSEVLTKWKKFFLQIAAQQGLAGLPAVETKLEVTVLQKSLENMGLVPQAEIQDWFTGEMLGLSGTVDLLDWNGLIHKTQLSRLFLVPGMQTGQLEPLLSHFTEEEDGQMKRLLQRMDILAKRAVELGVRLMVDAEQTYFQPAISCLTLEMQRKFNVEKPVIFNTYQCYLKEAYDAISLDIELARRQGWCFAAKLVRGAYMAQERARAEQVGYEDPINPTYEATNAMYYRCLNHILEDIKHRGQASVMVASHNEDTVRYTMRRMAELGLHPADKKVYFGQLLGMCDQITFPLGQAGYPVYKYVPYGPVKEVLPYLSRRALENRGVLKGAQRERELLWKEVKRRLLSGNLFYQPRAG